MYFKPRGNARAFVLYCVRQRDSISAQSGLSGEFFQQNHLGHFYIDTGVYSPETRTAKKTVKKTFIFIIIFI
jgi:hypothetical protein